jgi:Protein kinase G tetratricopeptide repeat
MLTKEQAAAAVAAATGERDAIQANLLDLDGSFGKRLLAGASLTGETRQRWETAAAALAGLWETYAAFSRLLHRATNADPDRRFDSTGEMAEQLTGVLREVLATSDGTPRPAFSRVFSPELRAAGSGAEGFGNASSAAAGSGAGRGRKQGAGKQGAGAALPQADEVTGALPVPLVEGSDPAAGYLATLGSLDPGQQAAALLGAVRGEAGVPQAVAGSAETRLALARALIVAGDPDGAAAYLAELAADNPGDWRIAWYNGLRELGGTPAAAARAAGGRLGRLTLDDARRQQLTVEILRAALEWASGQQPKRSPGKRGQGQRGLMRAQPSADGLILGCEPNERALRFGLERSYRALARLTPDETRRVELVDMANAIRPRTWT